MKHTAACAVGCAWARDSHDTKLVSPTFSDGNDAGGWHFHRLFPGQLIGRYLGVMQINNLFIGLRGGQYTG
jgi:hypothetical protein